ncbi:MAG: hypothetical protein ACI9SP_002118 [Arenicella sp.]|jgi:hypothetical protein
MYFANQETMTHVLYARGKLLELADRRAAIQQIATMTSKSCEQIEERLLSGTRKRVKSSESLSKLMRLETKFRDAGFDVYIDNK